MKNNDEQVVISKHFAKFIKSCEKDLSPKNDEDYGYIFYLANALSISCLKNANFCKHKVTELVEDNIEVAFSEDTSLTQ